MEKREDFVMESELREKGIFVLLIEMKAEQAIVNGRGELGFRSGERNSPAARLGWS